jgi:predicted dehydrogenase
MVDSGNVYRVCILGCRGRGTAAGRAYHSHPRTEVVGLCDLKPDLLQTLGEELGVDARYTDLDRMISELSPDIVAIPTGTEFHYDLCMRVLDYGVNIDVEKPICVDLAQADEVIKTAASRGVRTAVHHQGRVGASMRAVSGAVKKGRIGKLRHITASGKGYYGGYGLMNIGTHLINYILEIAGSCSRVSAIALTNGRTIGPEDVLPSPATFSNCRYRCVLSGGVWYGGSAVLEKRRCLAPTLTTLCSWDRRMGAP